MNMNKNVDEHEQARCQNMLNMNNGLNEHEHHPSHQHDVHEHFG